MENKLGKVVVKGYTLNWNKIEKQYDSACPVGCNCETEHQKYKPGECPLIIIAPIDNEKLDTKESVSKWLEKMEQDPSLCFVG